LRDATHSFAGGLYLIGVLALIAAMLSLAVRRPAQLNAP
jgi:ACS family tartrate transporter-like MFS transporter